MSDAAQEEQYNGWPSTDSWEADLIRPGPWVVVLMAFMVTAGAIAWGIFLIG